MVMLLSALVLGQASPSTWVALSKYGGMTGPAALGDVAKVREAVELAGVPTVAAKADVTSCQKKLPCLLKAARKLEVRYLVLVDTARVFDQAIVKVELLSVEEDGRRLQGFLVETTAAATGAQVQAKTAEVLGPPLREALGLAAPPPEAPLPPPPPPPPPPAAVAAPVVPPSAPEAPPAELVAQPAPTSGLRVASYVLGGLGLAAAGVGVYFGVETLSAVGERDRLCPPSEQCDSPRAFALDTLSRERQLIGLLVGGGGAALIATSLVLFLVSTPARAPLRAVVVPLAGGLSFSLAVPW